MTKVNGAESHCNTQVISNTMTTGYLRTPMVINGFHVCCKAWTYTKH